MVKFFIAGTDLMESSMRDLAVSEDMPAGMSKRSSPLRVGPDLYGLMVSATCFWKSCIEAGDSLLILS